MRTLLAVTVFYCCVLSFARASGVSGSNRPDRSNTVAFRLYVSGTDTMPRKQARPNMILMPVSGKLHDVFYFAIPAAEFTDEKGSVKKIAPEVKRPQLLKVTGNILYDVNYRSRIDTPYNENNVYQHTVQTRLDLLYKEKYPFRLYVTSRFSNSSLFRKYTDLNFQFSQADFKRKLKQQVFDAVQQHLLSQNNLRDSLKRVLNEKMLAISAVSMDLQAPNLKQKILEEKERLLLEARKQLKQPNVPGRDVITDSLKLLFKKLNNDSAGADNKYNRYKDSLDAKKQQLDSLIAEYHALEAAYEKIRSAEQTNLAGLKKQIDSAKDAQGLEDKLHELKVPDSVLPKGYKTLYSLQSFSIGRSVADYSELSVKNVSITGLQVEYNPHYYYAVAVGKVDYRFRDYIVPNHARSSQYLALARFGKGTKNGNHIIFTYYTGKRQFFNASIASQPAGGIPEYNLAGISIEGIYALNKNISLIGEVAKSTMPYYSLDSLQSKGWMNAVTRFSERSNEAYSVKLLSRFPKTGTRFSGNLQYTGANFQSFSTYTTGASQLKWKTQLEQPLFKKQLTLISSLQQNDYNNPFVTTAYKSSSLLASFQANLRIKKWPVLSFGYYPSYQLTKTGDDAYSESRYYTLTGSAGYNYNFREAQLCSYVVYSRFYNSATDSGFVYYNSKNILFSQSVAWDQFSVMGNVSLSTGTDYNMYTFENTCQVMINKIVSVGGGGKMIRYSLNPQTQWGYNANLNLKIPKLGDIQLMTDEGYLPALNKQLVKNRTGRLTYYKTF
ncbi:hypothetical protein A4H97_08845 [Niastella yeongjuensis]|uniref:Uncharacterized protein n=1 Tax=Niastella yeongjuensis TaxID=354355 RepID=A0A1V9EEC2_9BACT|nr:hypothetical protein [Niastella yeongjuensis]OQP44473.1 hypothetical protein A4H97_08845 [Niastella yeongjuensis]SEO86430.1 hypothetical protein SAMN05660816_03777 [Niastella yeongjuensis]